MQLGWLNIGFGALLMQVQTDQGIFSSTGMLQCRLSYSVHAAPRRSHVDVCVMGKNPKHWQPYHCFHTLAHARSTLKDNGHIHNLSLERSVYYQHEKNEGEHRRRSLKLMER